MPIGGLTLGNFLSSGEATFDGRLVHGELEVDLGNAHDFQVDERLQNDHFVFELDVVVVFVVRDHEGLRVERVVQVIFDELVQLRLVVRLEKGVLRLLGNELAVLVNAVLDFVLEVHQLVTRLPCCTPLAPLHSFARFF